MQYMIVVGRIVDVPVRYYFDLLNDIELVRDDVGVEADDALQAIRQAIIVLGDMRANDEIEMGTGWELVVRDADDRILKRLTI